MVTEAAGGVRNLAWLFSATLGAMLLAHPLFTAIVARLPRHRFVPLVYRFIVNLMRSSERRRRRLASCRTLAR